MRDSSGLLCNNFCGRAAFSFILIGPVEKAAAEPRGFEPMDEKEFYDERAERKPATLHCPHCRQSAEYDVGWLVRTKKRSLPGRADERDRAKFAKARSYMVRTDDMLACKNVRCRKRFEISSLQSVAFLD